MSGDKTLDSNIRSVSSVQKRKSRKLYNIIENKQQIAYNTQKLEFTSISMLI